MINRSDPQVFNLGHLPPAARREPPVLDGLPASVVSADDHAGAATLLVALPPNWSAAAEQDRAMELFVLEGEVTSSGEALAAGGYAYLPPGSTADLRTAGGAKALVFWSPAASAPAAAPVARDSWDIPWEPTSLPGFPAGGMHKSLRPGDELGGAHGGTNGFLRLVLVPAGWTSPREERHVDCWEENILLRGDMLMPGRGVLGPGDCLANPRGFWHGPMVTRGGALFLVNCDAPMPLEYRDHPPGDGELRRYLATASWF